MRTTNERAAMDPVIGVTVRYPNGREEAELMTVDSTPGGVVVLDADVLQIIADRGELLKALGVEAVGWQEAA